MKIIITFAPLIALAVSANYVIVPEGNYYIEAITSGKSNGAYLSLKKRHIGVPLATGGAAYGTAAFLFANPLMLPVLGMGVLGAAIGLPLSYLFSHNMLQMKFPKKDQKPFEFSIKHQSKDSKEFYLLTSTHNEESELALAGKRMKKASRGGDVLVAEDAGSDLAVFLKLQRNQKWLRAYGRRRVKLSSKTKTAWKLIPSN